MDLVRWNGFFAYGEESMTDKTVRSKGMHFGLSGTFRLYVVAALAVAIAACGGRNTGGPGNNNNEPIPCETVDQCPPGWDCQGHSRCPVT